MDHVELAGGEEDRAQVSVPLVDHQAHHADHGGMSFLSAVVFYDAKHTEGGVTSLDH